MVPSSSRDFPRAGRRIALVALLSASAALGQTPLNSPTEASATPEEAEPSLEVSVAAFERGGRPVRLRADDLTMSPAAEDADRLRIVGLEPSDPARTRLVLYFDAALSSTAALRSAAQGLLEHTEALVSLGEVEVVLADPDPVTILPAGRDAQRLGNALQRIFLRTEGQASLLQRREMFLRGEEPAAAFGAAQQPPPDGGALLALSPEERLTLASQALRDEIFLLQTQQGALLTWIADHRDAAFPSSYLFLVQQGFAGDPLAFYLQHASGDELGRLAAAVPSAALAAEAIAAHGFILFPLRSAEDEQRALRYAPSEDVPVGFRLRLGGRDRREDREDPSDGAASVTATVASLQAASASAGGVSIAVNQLGEVLDDLSSRRVLRLAGASTSSSTDLDLRLREPGERVLQAPRTLPVGHHPLVAATRLRQAFSGAEASDMDLMLESSFILDTANPQQRAGLLRAVMRKDRPANLGTAEAEQVPPALPTPNVPSALSAATSWRISVLFATVDGETSLRQTTLRGTSQAPAESSVIAEPTVWREPGGDLVFAAPFELPEGTNAVALVVEHLDSGTWGYSTADLVTRTSSGGDSSEPQQPETALRLLPPSARLVSGRVTFEVATTPEVERVVYYLGGKRVARRSRPPFDVTLNLGTTPRTLQLVAAAFDRSGNELARDRLLLNEPPEAFWVRIVAPEPGADVAGATQVAAQLRVPADGNVDTVDFFWKSRRLASLSEPPFEADVRLPVGEPDGFLRVEARLRDGRLAEDVLLVNQGGFGEQIGVELVELYVVAADRQSKPVRGLTEGDFEVFEDGRPQTIESFEAAGDLPLTIGLAIDSSSSLFLRMPEVRSAAARFVQSLATDRDRAFLVGFGSEPTLVAGTTRDLRRIETAIGSLEPYGTTAVWGAMDLALQQLDGVSGRKALVVFYDGDDEDEERFFERSLRLARRTNVPIYVVLMNDMAARTSGRSLSSRSFVGKLDRITRAGGGRVFYVRKDQALEPIFDAIAEELRSHYLLTYYPEVRPGGPLWRPVEVRVKQRGIEARTIEGRDLQGP